MANAGTQPIIILSGPPGAGKSTVAREIIKASESPLVYIEGDQFWSFYAKGFESRKPYENFKTIMSAMTAASVAYALAGFKVLLDFSIPPWFLPNAVKIVSLRDIPLHYIVLRPKEDVCARRAANRVDGSIGDYVPFHDLYIDFDEADQYTIKGELEQPEAIAKYILQAIDDARFQVR